MIALIDEDAFDATGYLGTDRHSDPSFKSARAHHFGNNLATLDMVFLTGTGENLTQYHKPTNGSARPGFSSPPEPSLD